MPSDYICREGREGCSGEDGKRGNGGKLVPAGPSREPMRRQWRGTSSTRGRSDGQLLPNVRRVVSRRTTTRFSSLTRWIHTPLRFIRCSQDVPGILDMV